MLTIHWNDIKPVYLSAANYQELAFKVSKSKLRKIEFFPFQREILLFDTYSCDAGKGRCELRIYKDSPKRYIYMASKTILDKVEDEDTGYSAYQQVDALFQETHKQSILSAFSGRKYSKEYNDIKKCVPVQISYLSEKFTAKIIDSVYKADTSSAFPSQIVGKTLPTLHGAKRVIGRAKPTEEYPFAFYIKSHHLAIYKELDTRTFDNIYYREYYHLKYKDNVKDEETILCKAFKGELDYAFKYLYEHRGENSDFKFAMNACIGYFQKNSNPALSPISAVIIARCNNDIMNKCNQLVDEGNKIVFIATDSIAWVGKESSIAEDNKYLGSFTYESKNCKFYGVGPKAYQTLCDGVIVTKYSGMKKDKRDVLEFGSLPNTSEYIDDSIYVMTETKNGIAYPTRIM